MTNQDIEEAPYTGSCGEGALNHNYEQSGERTGLRIFLHYSYKARPRRTDELDNVADRLFWADFRMTIESGSKALGHITSVDAARGLLAFSVMAFHVLSTENIAAYENVAYYAVYAFFMISGFSLWISYWGRLQTSQDIRAYLIKRFFRIAPLYYVALAIRILLDPLPASWPLDLLANATLLLGFYNPGASSLITGGWSLGIEFVFYLLLPILLITIRSTTALVAVTAAALVMQFMFINIVLGDAQVMTAPLWSQYSQPASFVGYFLAGCLIGEAYRISGGKQMTYSLPLACLTLLTFAIVQSPYPIGFLTGLRGLLLASLTIVFVASVAFAPRASGRLRKASEWLGMMSYPVYLLHPLVHHVVRDVDVPTSQLRIFLVFAGTLALSTVVSRRLEVPLREFGRRLAAKT